MRFKTLFAVCALFGSLFQSSPALSETLRTAWLGEHEAFLTWYAKEKGWDKEARPTTGPSPDAEPSRPCGPP